MKLLVSIVSNFFLITLLLLLWSGSWRDLKSNN